VAAAADRSAANRAADARAAAWAMEWSAWYGQCMARTAEQSEKTVELYRRVADATSRGELAQTALQDMLGAFQKARGTVYSERFAALTSRFFSRLVETAAIYSRDLAEGVMPGMPAPPPLPQLDPTDANAWFRQLTDYGNSVSTHIATSYKSFLDEVATGRVGSEDLKNTASEYLERRFPDYLRQLGRLYFDLLNDLNELRAAGEQDFLSGVLATAGRSEASVALSMSLRGPPSTVASATVSIANAREQVARIRYRVTEVRRADGIGPAFPPKISVTPDQLELQSSEEGSLTLALALDETDYAPDTLYIGALHITGHGEPYLEVPLQIMMTSRASPPDNLLSP
jgi:hypothetical protein